MNFKQKLIATLMIQRDAALQEAFRKELLLDKLPDQLEIEPHELKVGGFSTCIGTLVYQVNTMDNLIAVVEAFSAFEVKCGSWGKEGFTARVEDTPVDTPPSLNYYEHCGVYLKISAFKAAFIIQAHRAGPFRVKKELGHLLAKLFPCIYFNNKMGRWIDKASYTTSSPCTLNAVVKRVDNHRARFTWSHKEMLFADLKEIKDTE